MEPQVLTRQGVPYYFGQQFAQLDGETLAHIVKEGLS